MRALITTLHRENYGAHNWDGQGECPQHWKNKAHYEYVVELPEDATEAQQAATLDRLSAAVCYQNAHGSEHTVCRRILLGKTPTPDEDSFLDMLAEGYATEAERAHFQPKVFTLSDLEAGRQGMVEGEAHGNA